MHCRLFPKWTSFAAFVILIVAPTAKTQTTQDPVPNAGSLQARDASGQLAGECPLIQVQMLEGCLASTACVLIGMIMMLVTIRHLGRSFSLVPQARNVVQTGPYRWIKHPLYLAEEIAVLGVVLRNPTPLTAVLLVLHIGVQVCRILYEEDLLRRNCPEYSSYEASRWRLIPYSDSHKLPIVRNAATSRLCTWKFFAKCEG